MRIKLKNGREAKSSDILYLENSIGKSLPKQLVEFVRNHDGSIPETNIFRISCSNEGGVQAFIPIDEILNERRYVRGIGKTDIPIAWVEGGNYVVMDLSDGRILFWDHEVPEPLIVLTSDFNYFLDLLSPFDPISVKLQPDQKILDVWVDPEFLKSIEE